MRDSEAKKRISVKVKKNFSTKNNIQSVHIVKET